MVLMPEFRFEYAILFPPQKKKKKKKFHQLLNDSRVKKLLVHCPHL
jgi:hypothetical protein